MSAKSRVDALVIKLGQSRQPISERLVLAGHQALPRGGCLCHLIIQFALASVAGNGLVPAAMKAVCR